jgi:hypothetical protein
MEKRIPGCEGCLGTIVGIGTGNGCFPLRLEDQLLFTFLEW